MRRIICACLIMLVAVIVCPFTKRGQSASPKNVIFITVDTLRADRLGCYGYKHDTSPHIDEFVKKGVVFDDATCNIPLTTPSFASLFTSRYPHQVGSIRNGIPMVDGVKPLASMFKENGYYTAAILSNWPLKAHLSNLQQGFDLYEDSFEQKRYLFINDERDAETVSDLALKWLDKKPDEPFFAWIHYSDPHAPYVRHKKFLFSHDYTDSANYDSEVAYTDHHIGRLIDKIEEMDLLDRSLIIFTADHGESLGEHNYTGHGRKVYQPGMHIPLAVMGPGIPAGKREDSLVELLDLAPTVLAYAGMEPAEDMLGTNLLPCIRGEKECPRDRTVFYETFAGAAPNIEGADKFLTKPIYVGLRHDNIKLMYRVRYSKWERYDIKKDPDEENNLVDVGDPDFQKESDRLMEWYGKWEGDAVVGETGAMTEEDRKKFEALGYIDNP
ncbi:MAG: sulfatase [bacterium]